MYTTATDGLARAKRKPLSVGIIACDPAIGRDETLRRLLGVLGGVMQPGPAREAIVGFVDFRPYEMSAVMPWLAPSLSDMRGHWPDAFRSLCKLKLTKIRRALPCRWCGSRHQYHATDRNGNYVGVACEQCGHIADGKSQSLRRPPR